MILDNMPIEMRKERYKTVSFNISSYKDRLILAQGKLTDGQARYIKIQETSLEEELKKIEKQESNGKNV